MTPPLYVNLITLQNIDKHRNVLILNIVIKHNDTTSGDERTSG